MVTAAWGAWLYATTGIVSGASRLDRLDKVVAWAALSGVAAWSVAHA